MIRRPSICVGEQSFSQAALLLDSEAFQIAKKNLLEVLLQASAKLQGIRSGDSVGSEAKAAYHEAIAGLQADKGRELYFPFLSSGLGRGPFVELIDGSVKYDMITGIGVNFFGHSHPELMSEMIDALPADVMQGNLQPGHEQQELLRAILTRVGPGARLEHGWLLCSGTMANEFALKIIRQKKFPATKVLAFRDCFAGRSTAMQEITDNPKYREGQPVYGEALYLPFHDEVQGLEESVGATVAAMREAATRYPGKIAALMIELVQGEGGFKAAPREYYVRVFDEARRLGLAIWVDEVQTFGRTGELFAYQKFGLHEYVDVVTVGKLLQACAVLYARDFNPRAGLIAGTFSGSSVALRTGRRIVEMLTEDGYLGEDGRIERLARRFRENLRRSAEGRCRGLIGDIRAVGGMMAFQPLGGTMEEVKAVLMRLFDLGVIAFYCGHGPYLVRLLPPCGALSEAQLDDVCGLIETALVDVGEKGK
ncbi:MAG: aminotransferase class III-fold pyridoxal phosphate-dependent enzyme [Oligoflexia bacterium]|nr:aminotransferase class III-fold pyridoxal phosphate-dependent enzyme [Oligoflexia bacterium]